MSLTEDEVFGVLQGTLLKPKCLLPETLTPCGISLEKEDGESLSLPMTWSSYQDFFYSTRYSITETLNQSLPLVGPGMLLGILAGAIFSGPAWPFFVGAPAALFVGSNLLYPFQLLARGIMRKLYSPRGYQHIFGAIAGEKEPNISRIAVIISSIQDRSLRARIAESLPEDLLAKVIFNWNLEGERGIVLKQVLAQKATDPDILILLSKLRNVNIRLAVAKNPAAPLEALKNIFDPQKLNALSDAAAKNPNSSVEMLAQHLWNVFNWLDTPEKKEQFLRETIALLKSQQRVFKVLPEIKAIDPDLYTALNSHYQKNQKY